MVCLTPTPLLSSCVNGYGSPLHSTVMCRPPLILTQLIPSRPLRHCHSERTSCSAIESGETGAPLRILVVGAAPVCSLAKLFVPRAERGRKRQVTCPFCHSRDSF